MMQHLHHLQTVSQVSQLTNMSWNHVCILKFNKNFTQSSLEHQHHFQLHLLWCLKTNPIWGQRQFYHLDSMAAAHSGVYSTFCMSLHCVPSADGYGSQPAVTLINGTIKFTASVYFILLMRVLFSKYSFFKRYSNSAVLFYCCVDMGEVVICTSCFLSLVRMLEEQSCLD